MKQVFCRRKEEKVEDKQYLYLGDIVHTSCIFNLSASLFKGIAWVYDEGYYNDWNVNISSEF